MEIKPLSADFAVSPQIAATDMATLKAQGFTDVICNRPDGEDPGQPSFATIAAKARAAGLTATHIPIRPGLATRADVAAFDAALKAASGKVLAYCRSGGRAETLYAATGR